MFYPSALQYFSALQRLSFHWRQRRDVIGFCILALFCSGGTLIPTDALAGNQTQYIVDGLALGAAVAPRSATYREYKCHPSEQFASFVWCQRVRTEQSKFGDVTSTNSILHSEIGATAYVSQYIDPAFFGPGDIKREIERLSQRFGSSPHILRSPRRPNERQSVTKGMLFDFLGNFGDSARFGRFLDSMPTGNCRRFLGNFPGCRGVGRFASVLHRKYRLISTLQLICGEDCSDGSAYQATARN